MIPLLVSLAFASPPASVTTIADLPTLEPAPNTATITEYARGEHAFVGELTLAPGGKVPEHQDASEEYLIVLEGSGSLTMDGTIHALKPGMVVFMPAGSTVSYVNGSETLRVIQVFAGPESAAKYDAWKPVAASKKP